MKIMEYLARMSGKWIESWSAPNKVWKHRLFMVVAGPVCDNGLCDWYYSILSWDAILLAMGSCIVEQESSLALGNDRDYLGS